MPFIGWPFMGSAMLVDATGKNCKGIIASLENAIKKMHEGERIEAVVSGIPNRVDVYAWASRKGHKVNGETRDGSIFRITIVK